MVFLINTDKQIIPELNLMEETTDIHSSFHTQLAMVTGVKLDYEANSGELQCRWNALQGADNYTYQFYTRPTNPGGSVIKEGTVNKCKASINGLPKGQKVQVRVRGNNGAANGLWSESAEKRVP